VSLLTGMLYFTLKGANTQTREECKSGGRMACSLTIRLGLHGGRICPVGWHRPLAGVRVSRPYAENTESARRLYPLRPIGHLPPTEGRKQRSGGGVSDFRQEGRGSIRPYVCPCVAGHGGAHTTQHAPRVSWKPSCQNTFLLFADLFLPSDDIVPGFRRKAAAAADFPV